MDPITLGTILTALAPAAVDGLRGLFAKVTGSAGGQPQNVGEAIQLMDAEGRRLQTLSQLEGSAETYKWVAAVRQMQRPVIVALVTLAWVIVNLAPETYDDFTQATVAAAAQSVWFYLFGERVYFQLKGQKK
jgi:hypothetical protein